MTTTQNNRPRATALVLGIVAAIVLPALIVGCNTVEGAGQDVSGIGRGVSGAASETQQAIFPEER